jgi:hypothetical protein
VEGILPHAPSSISRVGNPERETVTRTISEEETEILLYWILGTKFDINEETRANEPSC